MFLITISILMSRWRTRSENYYNDVLDQPLFLISNIVLAHNAKCDSVAHDCGQHAKLVIER